VNGRASRTPISLRRPRITLLVGAIILLVLGAIGLGVNDRLKPTSLEIHGTDSSKANELLRKHFGDSAPFAILLEGPKAQLDKQGPRLIRALREDPKVTTLSPWDRGQVDQLRPSPRQALIVADFHVPVEEAVRNTVPHLNEVIEQEISAPVRATQTGFATLSRAIQDESIKATHRGELIALPILLIVLLLVFRSPVAAAVPLICGGLVVFASRGILYFFTSWMSIDGFALVVCTMMGLALGVDYALLMVSRFREEIRDGAEPMSAAITTRRTSGRTVLFAAATLVLSMATAMLVLPGSLLVSLAGTVIMVTALSALVALIGGPALLYLLGNRIDLWRIGGKSEGRSRLMAVVNGALRNPGVATFLIGSFLLLLALPMINLKTGPPSPEQLPQDNPVRKDTERLAAVMGPGWDAPFTIISAADFGTITDPDRLERLVAWQRRIAADEAVQAVVGPGQIAERTKPLQQVGPALMSDDAGPLSDLARLGRQLGRATGGVELLREGLNDAAYGAGLLGSGADQAKYGAAALANGLEQAGEGSQQAVDALERFSDGARRLAAGEEEAMLGALRIKLGIRDLVSILRNNVSKPLRQVERDLRGEAGKTDSLKEKSVQTEQQLRSAIDSLEAMTTGKADPVYQSALDAARAAYVDLTGRDPDSGEQVSSDYSGLPTELEGLAGRLRSFADEADRIAEFAESVQRLMNDLADGAGRLQDGTRRLQKGAKQLASGAERLTEAAGELGDGLSQLIAGSLRLADGIGLLEGGADELAAGLASGYDQSQPLETGLRRATVQVTSGARQIRTQVNRLRRSSPGLFNSGHFVLSALDGAPPEDAEVVGQIVDLNRAGQATAILVIPTATFNTPESIALDERLDRLAARLAEDTNTTAGVAGGASQLNDYGRITRDRIPLVVLAIAIATFLVLVVVLRALLLAALAVALNLLSVAVAFGVLTLLFELPADWPLGGRTYVDAVGATAIFGVVFGLSIDYAVFLLARMREHFDATGEHEEAIRFGLDRTARVITGAALIMMAVFVAFAGAPIATVSQLGVGLTVAVLLDATVIRIILLPALMLLMGPRIWWIPGWLDRRLPKLDA
jgi:RND superfamily putative drug exporter